MHLSAASPTSDRPPPRVKIWLAQWVRIQSAQTSGQAVRLDDRGDSMSEDDTTCSTPMIAVHAASACPNFASETGGGNTPSFI
jgi:hypothetical protein